MVSAQAIRSTGEQTQEVFAGTTAAHADLFDAQAEVGSVTDEDDAAVAPHTLLLHRRNPDAEHEPASNDSTDLAFR